MATFVWHRGIDASEVWQLNNRLLLQIGSTHSIVRTRMRWGFYADTAITTDLAFVSQNLLTMAFVTTVGNGTETPPNPRTAPNNAAPPTQRYIYWETRAPVVTSMDSAAGIVTWRDSGATEETDTHSQVLATGLPPGDTLNLWANSAAPFNWDPSGTASIWLGWEVLIRIPLCEKTRGFCD